MGEMQNHLRKKMQKNINDNTDDLTFRQIFLRLIMLYFIKPQVTATIIIPLIKMELLQIILMYGIKCQCVSRTYK